MPLYEYECIYCGFKFELRKNMSESDSIEYCPQCGSECNKLISGGNGFILGGDGWAKDGYSDIKGKGGTTNETS